MEEVTQRLNEHYKHRELYGSTYEIVPPNSEIDQKNERGKRTQTPKDVWTGFNHLKFLTVDVIISVDYKMLPTELVSHTHELNWRFQIETQRIGLSPYDALL